MKDFEEKDFFKEGNEITIIVRWGFKDMHIFEIIFLCLSLI
jgi:hypothetical protein